MAKETKPVTYRVSSEVDKELRRLAKKQGGIDKALRVLLDMPEYLDVKPPGKTTTYRSDIEYDQE